MKLPTTLYTIHQTKPPRYYELKISLNLTQVDIIELSTYQQP